MRNSYYIELPKHVKYMSREDLLRYFPPGEYTNAFLMRSLIMNEKDNYRSTRDSRTLRGVWYSTVKPALDKLGLLTEEDQTEAGLTKWDATLSRYMAELLRKGYLLYSDLGIIDVSRRKKNPKVQYSVPSLSSFGYKVNVAPYPNILIATEKDTVYNIISSIADLFGCSCISCKGQNALGAMEVLINNIRDRYFRREWDTFYILTMTDYDPAGYYIADALVKQARDILNALGMRDVRVKYARIGITPDQLSDEMVEANKYTPKPANIEKWLKKTGGINGEPKGLELDALEPDQIREIFVNNISDYIDEEVYKDFVKSSYIKSVVLEGIASKIDDLVEKVTNRIDSCVTVRDFDVSDYAKRGYDSIPVWSLCDCEIAEEEIHDIAKKYITV